MGALQPEHLILLLVIVLIVFGAGRLPDTFRDLGRGVRNFRAEAEGKSAPEAPAAAAATVTCPACGKTSPAGAKFCSSCGKAL